MSAPSVQVQASATGIRAWADLMGRAALRLRMADTSMRSLFADLADLLDDEIQGEHGIDHCPGRKCPSSDPHTFACPAELDEGFVDEDTHHHCRWCLALSLSWEHPEPTAVRLARIVLAGSA